MTIKMHNCSEVSKSYVRCKFNLENPANNNKYCIATLLHHYASHVRNKYSDTNKNLAFNDSVQNSELLPRCKTQKINTKTRTADT